MNKSIRSRSHLIIPDVQAKAGVPLEHLSWIGQYIADKRPDVVVCIGDFADMPSLSSYDKGKKSFEGRRYKKDIEAAREAMGLLMEPIGEAQAQDKRAKKKSYDPRLILTLGNHEDRISRAIEEDPKLEGTISLKDLGYEEHGWEVIPFLKPITVDGISYCHYFQTGAMGRPVSSARALVKAKHCSAIMGHTQATDVFFDTTAAGKHITGLFCGTCYLHEEDYLGPQANQVKRQIVMLHEVNDGEFDLMFVSLEYLRRKYGK